MEKPKKLCITIDIEWARDDVLNETVDILEQNNICATFFVTHDTPVLDRIRENQNFELGIHPNFNNLLQNKGEDDAEKIVNKLLEVVPEAKGVRSHSLTNNGQLVYFFKKAGLEYDMNYYLPYDAGIPIKPFRLWNGLIRIPFCWEDDINMLYHRGWNGSDVLEKTTGDLIIFNFHPIHIYFNTADIETYNRIKQLNDKERLEIKKKRERIKSGTGTFFKELIKTIKENSIKNLCCKNIMISKKNLQNE